MLICFQPGKLAGSHNTLFKTRKRDTGTCDFCGHEETLQHVMLFCQKYDAERSELKPLSRTMICLSSCKEILGIKQEEP